MQSHQQPHDWTEVRLTTEEQETVLAQAWKLQAEHSDKATLAELIQAGQEVGLSRQAIEEAYRAKFGPEAVLAAPVPAFHVSTPDPMVLRLGIVMAAATWLAVILAPQDFQSIHIVTVLANVLLFPLIVGWRIRNPLLACGISAAAVVNLAFIVSLRFGPPAPSDFLPLFGMMLTPSFIALAAWAVRGWSDKPSPRA
jgi:hypothetical protein